tara:strand:+ start:259 stop:522 length:264 start_codon:yes stop_codon:yes gene_type:complete
LKPENLKTKKKISLIVKEETIFGISLMVDESFDEDRDSEILKGVLRDFPKSSRRTIIQGQEIMVINEGEMRVVPDYYLNKTTLEKLN